MEVLVATLNSVKGSYTHRKGAKKIPDRHIYEVHDKVFIGDFIDSKDKEQLQRHNVTKIVNLAIEIESNDTKIPWVTIPINDTTSENVYTVVETWDKTTKEIQNHDGNILINCFAGKSRSASAIVYYLMKVHKLSLDEAIGKLRTHLINSTFMTLLKMSEIILN